MKIATWNVNSLRVRLEQVVNWLQQNLPDYLVLQETKLTDEQFPTETLQEAGYHCYFSGQPKYNGVAILSHKKMVQIGCQFPSSDDTQKRLLAAAHNEKNLCVLNLYIPNGAEVDSEKYVYKLNWLKELQSYVRQLQTQYQNLLILGDFNIAPEDRDVHDIDQWQGKILVSEKERTAFFELINLGFIDCFRLFDQAPKSFSWWDYRAASFRRNIGVRIDHVLASKELATYCRSCYIDSAPRKLERPSDHTPVVATFDI